MSRVHAGIDATPAPRQIDGFVGPLIFAGAVVAFGLIVPAAVGALDSRPWVRWLVGLWLAAAIVQIARYALQGDPYFGGLSRWEHGMRFEDGTTLVASLVVGVVVTAAAWLAMLGPGKWPRLAFPFAFLAFGALLVTSWELAPHP